jgi:3-phenylpropionate/cinnamic acid dioxygenase small subunit
VQEDGSWKISSKIIRLANDVVPTMLDIYGI